MAQGQRRSKGAFHRIVHNNAFAGIDRDRTPQRSFNGRTRTYRRPLSTPHDLHRSDYWDQEPEHKVQAAHRHRGRRPPSLKKGGRSEAHREPPRRLWHLARQRLGPDTSRGRPGARHPPLRRDSATPGRLPAALRRWLDHDGQARSTRPERALLPGFFGLGQPTWAGGAAGHICRGCSEDAGPWATRPLGSCRSRCCCSAAAANLFRPCVGTRLLLLPRLYAAACRLHCRRSRSRGRDEQARLTLRLDGSQGLQP